jgi:hypothetical protein
MSTPKKSMLSSLSKPASTASDETNKSSPTTRTHKGIEFRMSLGDWKRLKMVAIERETTLQGLIEDGVNALLKQRGIEPISKWNSKE